MNYSDRLVRGYFANLNRRLPVSKTLTLKLRIAKIPMLTAKVTFYTALICFFSGQSVFCFGEVGLAILPNSFTLYGPNAEQRVVVQQIRNGEYLSSCESGVEFSTNDCDIIRIDDGVIRPVSNGQASILVRWNGKEAAASITVVAAASHASLSFRNDILPILTKAGCNMGACHGALAGKGGFKLSLQGYDAEADFSRIALEARGRRIELSDPGRSLILAKPTGAVPHKGGLRFSVESPEYQKIAQWIALGATPPQDDDARTVSIRVLPDTAILPVGSRQQLVVLAKRSNGQTEDVTRWAKFESTDTSVVEVDGQGRVHVVGHGEGSVTAWFDSKIVIARMTIPFEYEISPRAYDHLASENFIDNLVVKKLKRLNLQPSGLADDNTFIRRVFLDTIGTLPTSLEVIDFVNDLRTNKRELLIDTLLNRPEFVDYWAYRWSDVLLVNGQRLRPKAVQAYYHWIRKQVEDNTPWDEFVRSLVTSQGNSLENGATNFYALHQDAESIAENVCKAFLGLALDCAKCHNHPLEKWTNDQYYGMANMFARVRGKGWGGDPRTGDGERTVYAATSGELIQPSTRKPQPPTPLDGEPIEMDWQGDRRIPLADWLTAPENPYFARAITNRIWANFFGVGLVEEVDDLRTSNPASNEELLRAASQFVIDQNYDLKSLMRKILTSNAYQLSSAPLPKNASENRFYSRYYPRRMMAEVLLDSISQVANVPSEFSDISFPSSDKFATDFYPKGTRAIQLYDSAVMSHFLDSFGRNSRTITCECERTATPTLVQALHLSNGDTINEKLGAPGSIVDELIASKMEPSEILEKMYLTCLSRTPSDTEMSELLPYLESSSESPDREIIEDLLWSIMSSREFIFNH